jgi:hypothetical protein
LIKKLQDRINALNDNQNVSSGIMGFTRQNFVYLTLSVLCIFILSAYLIQPSQSNYFIADEESVTQENISEEEDTEIKDVEAQFAKKIVEIVIIKYFIFITMQITSEIGYLQFYEN